jgi:hypothetical protein
MNKELIKKLKDKNYVRAFGLMSNQEKEILLSVGYKNRLVYSSIDTWKDDTAAIAWANRSNLTYTIKPDYQPEPEYVDLEVESNKVWLEIKNTAGEGGGSINYLPYGFTLLHCLPSLPNFDCFYVVAKDLKPNLTVEISLCEVAKHVSEGKTVYARFRKG